MNVALLGTGLIGGSVGLALKKRSREVGEIIAYDRSEAAARRAVERGAADRAAASPAEAVKSADLVIIATPVGAILSVLQEALPALRAGTIITDVGSTKSQLIVEIEQALRPGLVFIGGHPMAGTEEEGIEAAKANLFEGAWWILTPTERVDPASYQRVHALITGIGAQVIALTPSQHDELLALISHLPHLTATVLMELAAERGEADAGLLALAAGGFRDVTRVAASNPEIWVDICTENRRAIADALSLFAERLLSVRDAVAGGSHEELRSLFERSRESRRNLPSKPLAGDLADVLIPVPDRPGVLAEVTTVVGNLGINIENIEISHAVEGGRGTLHLTIIGVDKAQQVLGALQPRGYEPRVIQR